MQKVSIQFKWFHHFSFAGYYTAVEKGFYAEEGLQVTLKERDPGKSHIQSVLDGDAEYGVADAGLVLDRIAGKPVVLLKQIFQHSPLVVMTRQDSGIVSPFDLRGKRLMLDRKGRSSAPILAMLNDALGGLDQVDQVEQTFDLGNFIAGDVDALAGYSTDQPFRLHQRGVAVNVIDPRDYGVDFYGDNFFTTETERRHHPARVEKMIRATLKGWQYALSHPDEIIDLIRQNYQPQLDRDALVYEARTTALMIAPEEVPLGTVLPDRYVKVAEGYRRAGLVAENVNLAGFIYQQQETEFEPKTQAVLQLTSAEQAWLKAHPTILIGADGDFPPYSFRDEKGTYRGLAIDFSDYLSRQLGITMKVVPNMSWSEIVIGIRQRSLDMILTAHHDSETEPLVRHSEFLLPTPLVIMQRKGGLPIAAEADLDGRIVAMVEGTALTERIMREHPAIKPMPVTTAQEALVAVATGMADACVGVLATNLYLTQINGLTNLEVALHYGHGKNGQCFGIREDWPELQGILDKVLATMPEAEKLRIFKLWLPASALPSLSDSHVAPAKQILLTSAEKDWIANHPLIRVGNQLTYAPFIFQQDGKPAGYAIDYVKLLAARLGIQLEFVQDSWSNLLKKVKDREVDVLPGLSNVPKERDSFLNFTEPYKQVRHAIISRRDIDNIVVLADLQGKRVASFEYYSSIGTLSQLVPDLRSVEVENTKASLEAVALGRAEATFTELPVANYLLRDKQFANLKVAAVLDPLGGMGNDYRLAVREDWPELIPILEKAMATIRPEELAVLELRWLAPSSQVALPGRIPTKARPVLLNWRILSGIGLGIVLITGMKILLFRLLDRSRKTPLAYQFSSPAGKRLAVLLNTVLIVVATLLAWWALGNIKEKIQVNVRESLQAVLQTSLKGLHVWDRERKTTLEVIAVDPRLVMLVSGQLARYKEGHDLLSSPDLTDLRKLPAEFPNWVSYSDALVVAPDGVMVASLHDANIGKTSLLQQNQPDMLRRAFAGETVLIPPTPSSGPQEDATSALAGARNPPMFFATPIRKKGGEVIAVLVVSLDPTDEFIRLYRSSRIGQTGETYVFNRQGRFLSESRFLHHLVMSGLIQPMDQTMLTVEARDPGGNLVNGYRTDIPRSEQPLTRMAASATQGYAGYDVEGYRDYRGVPVLGAWIWDDALDIGITSKIDEAEAMAGYHRAELVVAVALMVTVAGSCFFTLLIMVLGSRANRALQAARDLLEERVDRRTHQLKIFKLAVDTSPNSIVIADITGKIEYVNQAFTVISGYSAKEVINENPRIFHCGENPPELYEGLWKTILSGNIWRGEIIGRKKNGGNLIEYVDITPIADNSEVITHFAAVKVDITEKRNAEKVLKEALARAKEATSAKSAFLANMSHEIRTPMNAIMGMSYLLLQTELNERQRYYLRLIESSAKSLLALIDDILDISKIEAGKLTLEKTTFNITEIVDDVISLFLIQMDEKDLELHLSIAPHIPTVLLGDPVRLAQVFNNLLSNAVKFTEEGEIEIAVRLLELQAKTLTLECAVSDSGIGIPQKKVATLFEAFSQADTSTTRKYGGTGLGLAIVKQLVELMGGNIRVENVPNEGARFIFTLPLGYSPDRRKKERAGTLPLELVNRKVLLVVANRKKRQCMMKQLQSLSFHVDSCAGYHEASAVCAAAVKMNHRHELIIADYQSCKQDGLCVSATMNGCAGSADIPVILMLGIQDFSETEDFVKEYRRVSLLQKPATPRSFFNAIVEAFGYGELAVKKRHETADNQRRALAKVNGASILLVEDNIINQQVATELLKLVEVEVSIASNGVEALELVQQQNFDLVLMDIQMPEMDGLTATRKIRALESQAKDVTIVAMTANAMVGDRNRSLAAGMDDHIAKPLEPEALFSCLVRWIRPESGGDRRSIAGWQQSEDSSDGQRPESQEEKYPDLGLTIPGIDIAAGLKRVAGNKKLYLDLLRHFLMENENIGTQIKEAWNRGDQEMALRLAHTLKGLAGTIGAASLQEKALKLETGIKNGSENLLNLLEDTWNTLQPVLAGIGEIQHIDQKQGVTPVVAGASADIGSIMPKIRELEQLLLVNDMTAEDVFLEIQGVLSSQYPEQTEHFGRALDFLDFKQCLELLKYMENNVRCLCEPACSR